MEGFRRMLLVLEKKLKDKKRQLTFQLHFDIFFTMSFHCSSIQEEARELKGERVRRMVVTEKKFKG